MTLRKSSISTLLIGALLIMPIVHGESAERAYRVGLLSSASMGYWDQSERLFLYALQDYGYSRGKNLSFAANTARNRPDANLSALAAELIKLDLDVVVATDLQAAQALQNLRQTTPIVMLSQSDPVDAQLVASLARPGGNITGISILVAELAGKRLELLRDVLPNAEKVCVLRDRSNTDLSLWDATKDAAIALGLALQLLESSDSYDELMAAIEQAESAQCMAIVMLDGSGFWGNQSLIMREALQRQIPVICNNPAWASHAIGCLLAFGPEFEKVIDRLAHHVDQVLKGTPPAEIPIEQPTHFKLAINLWVAESLGIVIPPLVLVRADKIFE